MIRTEPDVPIKELHGHLTFVKDNEIIYETQLAEMEKVSFTDLQRVVLGTPVCWDVSLPLPPLAASAARAVAFSSSEYDRFAIPRPPLLAIIVPGRWNHPLMMEKWMGCQLTL